MPARTVVPAAGVGVSRTDGGALLGAATLWVGDGLSRDAELELNGAVDARPLAIGGIEFVSGNASADANDADDGAPVFPLSPFVLAFAEVPVPPTAFGKVKPRAEWFAPVLPI